MRIKNYMQSESNYDNLSAEDMRTEQVRYEMEQQKKKKVSDFLLRLEKFGDITTLEDAKDLAQKILPVPNDINTFKVGNAKCTVINREDMFRVCVDTPEKFISYDFT